MIVINTLLEMRKWIARKRKEGCSIGLVPTMGYLHEGHLSLVKKACRENDVVVMSIFVNPLQFGPREDYAAYPRDPAKDSQLAQEAGVDVIFSPSVLEMYPQYPPQTTVEVKEITRYLCGASRPGHFTGVATVVLKLFNIVTPDTAYFGQKDYQQAQVIRQMADDLNINVGICTVPIVREADGLAMSSRNTYLSPAERQQALCLSQALMICRKQYEEGERNSAQLKEAMKERIRKEPCVQLEYLEICDQQSLQSIPEATGSALVAVAVKIGKTRLIDNILLEEKQHV